MFPHGPLVKLAEDLHCVRGEIKLAPLGRRMVVVGGRGGLFVHNAIMLDEPTFAKLDALGPVRAIFVPNRFHDMDGGRMKERYPDASLYCMPQALDALKKKLAAVQPLDEGALPEGTTITAIPGLKGGECVMEVSRGGKVTQVYADTFFNITNARGVQGFIVSLMGSSGGFKMTRIGRMFMLDDKKAFLAWLDAQIARTDLERIVVAHGDDVEGSATEALARARKLLT